MKEKNNYSIKSLVACLKTVNLKIGPQAALRISVAVFLRCYWSTHAALETTFRVTGGSESRNKLPEEACWKDFRISK